MKIASAGFPSVLCHYSKTLVYTVQSVTVSLSLQFIHLPEDGHYCPLARESEPITDWLKHHCTAFVYISKFTYLFIYLLLIPTTTNH